jgi:hypothetical protein
MQSTSIFFIEMLEPLATSCIRYSKPSLCASVNWPARVPDKFVGDDDAASWGFQEALSHPDRLLNQSVLGLAALLLHAEQHLLPGSFSAAVVAFRSSLGAMLNLCADFSAGRKTFLMVGVSFIWEYPVGKSLVNSFTRANYPLVRAELP